MNRPIKKFTSYTTILSLLLIYHVSVFAADKNTANFGNVNKSTIRVYQKIEYNFSKEKDVIRFISVLQRLPNKTRKLVQKLLKTNIDKLRKKIEDGDTEIINKLADIAKSLETIKEQSETINNQSRTIENQSQVIKSQKEENERLKKQYAGYIYDNAMQKKGNFHYKEAIQLMRQAIDLDYKDKYLFAIGNIYQVDGDYDAAFKYHREALKIRLSRLSLDHPDVGELYNGLGNDLFFNKKYYKAMRYYIKALVIQADPDYPYFVKNYSNKNNNVGDHWLKGKNYIRAILNYDKALNIQIKHLDPGAS